MVYFDLAEAGLTIGLTVRRGLGRIGADKGGQSAVALKPFAAPAIETERPTSTLSRRKQGFESPWARQLNQLVAIFLCWR
jgi:hypothetical protein